MTLNLTNSLEACLVDKEVLDLPEIRNYSWRMSDAGYVWASLPILNSKKRKTTYLHRLIMKAVDGQFVDHADGNKLNNQKSNLRFCSKSENARNRKKVSVKTEFKGIWFDKKSKNWIAKISVNGKHVCPGRSKDPKIAAALYNEAAKKYFGDFARLNTI